MRATLILAITLFTASAFANSDNCQSALIVRIQNSAAQPLWRETERLQEKLSLYLLLSSAPDSSIHLVGSPEVLQTLDLQIKQLQQDLLASDLKDLESYERRLSVLTLLTESNLRAAPEAPRPWGYKARNLPGADEDWALFPVDSSSRR